MDSAKLLSALRSNTLTARTPIILLSTKNDRDTIRQVLDQGADDYLSLPITRETLLQTVAVRLRQPKAVRDVGDQHDSSGSHAVSRYPDGSGRSAGAALYLGR